MTTYTYTSLNYPGSLQSIPTGINNSGVVVGSYNDSSAVAHGFTETGGVFTSITYAGAQDTIAAGINDSGEVVGTYIDSSFNNHGFTDIGGHFTSVDYAGATATMLTGVNASGVIVGTYQDTDGKEHGFTDTGGTFAAVNVSGATDTIANGINATGEIVGAYFDDDDVEHGFTKIGNTYTTIDVPNSTSTTVTGVNASGELTGQYTNDSGRYGFTYSNGTFSTLDDPDPAAGNGTSANGLNDAGEVVGAGSASTGRSVGFEATPMPCYVTGTRIRTVQGDVAVEALAIGDVVVTASGAHRPIKWIGHRGYVGRFANANPDVLPICFKAGSLAEDMPARDLWVSPKHAMVLDGALVPAEFLVNGISVIKASSVESVTYWHIELESHDVLLAEGAPAESFVDDNGRGIFHNAHTFAALYPGEAGPVAAVYCAPRLEDGHQLEAIRRAIAARAGIVAEAPDCGALDGYIDAVDGGAVRGWVRNARNPAMPVCLDLVVEGRVVAQVLANCARADLDAAGYGPHGFEIDLPEDADGKRIEVRRSADGARLKRVVDQAA